MGRTHLGDGHVGRGLSRWVRRVRAHAEGGQREHNRFGQAHALQVRVCRGAELFSFCGDLFPKAAGALRTGRHLTIELVCAVRVEMACGPGPWLPLLAMRGSS